MRLRSLDRIVPLATSHAQAALSKRISERQSGQLMNVEEELKAAMDFS